MVHKTNVGQKEPRMSDTLVTGTKCHYNELKMNNENNGGN